MGEKLLEFADTWGQLLGPWGYGLLFLAAFIEYVLPVFPGDSVAVLGGAWAWRTSRSWLGVWLALTLGNALGIWLQHGLGQALARSAQLGKAGKLSKRLGALGMTEVRMAAMGERVRRHGVALLLINRFLPSFRALVFLAAGMSGLSLPKTLFWGVLGSLVWSAFILGAGAWLGGNAQKALRFLEAYQAAAAWAVGAVVVLWAAWWLMRRRRPKGAA